MCCPTGFHLKVISIKSHLIKYKRCPWWVPPLSTDWNSSTIQLSASVLGEICPYGQISCSQGKLGRGTLFPYSAKIQNLLTKQSNFTRHWSDNPQAESPWGNKYLINTKVTDPGVYEHRRCLWLSTWLKICFQAYSLFFIASYIIIILQLFLENPKQRGL